MTNEKKKIESNGKKCGSTANKPMTINWYGDHCQWERACDKDYLVMLCVMM